MGEEREKVKDHWMILQSGVEIWNRWREANPEIQPDLWNARLQSANLESANLKSANLKSAVLGDTKLVSAVLVGADLRNAVLVGAVLVGADLRNADLGGADLGITDLRDADLGGADLGGAFLMRADLEAAYLGGTNLEAAYLGGTNLKGADLERAKLKGANLRSADLRDAKLEGAILVHADLRRANLRGAYLGNAKLRGAVLKGADLGGLVFGSVDLEDANLGGTILEEADLARAHLHSTHFHNVDLREAKNLGEVIHRGPSPVSSQTLKKSQGQIPEKFLRGCGLEDWEILAARLHDPNLRPDEITDIAYGIDQVRGESPIVPLSVFISYSHEDTSFVEKLETRFDKDGIRYWRDVHDLNAGPIEHQVDRAIGMQRATLLVLSADSVDSDWVEHEVEHARKAEKKRQKEGRGDYLLCPIALDDSWKKCRWPERILGQVKKYSILDFSRWGSDEEFEKVYEKLKTGLGIYYADKGPPSDG